MNPPRRLRGTFGMCNLREGFVNLREGFVVAPWRLREAFSKTRSAKASRSPLEGFAKASRRRHGRLHLETIRQKMTSPRRPTEVRLNSVGGSTSLLRHINVSRLPKFLWRSCRAMGPKTRKFRPMEIAKFCGRLFSSADLQKLGLIR